MDEIASIANALAYADGGLLALARADRIAPLHSIVTYVAIALGGESALSVRLPSAIAGIASVPAFYFVALRVLGSRRQSLIGCAFVALSPYAVYYAQEARMYSLLLLLVCLYVGLSWPVLQRKLHVWELALLTLVTTAAFYTHHYMVLLTASFGFFLVIQGTLTYRRVLQWVLTQAIAFLMFMYWLALTSEQFSAQTALYKPGFLMWVPYTIYSFAVGLSFGPSVRDIQLMGAGTALLQHAPMVTIAGLALGVLGIAGLRHAFEPCSRAVGTWLLVWLLVPIGLAILATFVTTVQYNIRYAIISYPALAMLLAISVRDLRLSDLRSPIGVARGRGLQASFSSLNCTTLTTSARQLAAGGLFLCMMLSLSNWYVNEHYSKEDVRPLARILADSHSDNLVVLDNTRLTPILKYYGAPLPAGTLQVDNILWGRTSDHVLSELEDRAQDLPKEIWLIEYRSWETDPLQRIRGRLDALATPFEVRTWPGVSLRRYQAHPKS